MISNKSLMIRTAFPNIYHELVDVNDLFITKYHLFAFGLVYALMHNITSNQKLSVDIVRLNQIRDPLTKDIVDIVYLILDDGNKSEEQLFSQMLSIADGGIQELANIYAKNNDFNIPNLIIDAEKLWAERLPGLQNVISKSN